ncbi:MAG: hypothetical protein QF552_11950 [Litorilituus sp.]|jgi:hypothetical protein|nr:hypothetical protein [Litorilituus sp.]
MSLSQCVPTKYDCSEVCGAKQALDNEVIVAKNKQFPMFTLVVRTGEVAF